MDPNAPEVVNRLVGEIRASAFDFTNELISGESHSTVNVAVTPSGPTLGTPAISGATVQFMVTSGSSAGTYTVTCTTQTTASNTIIGVGQLVVSS